MRSARLSLDENVALNNNSKRVSPARSDKPKRRSLPNLPSEKTTIPGVITNAAGKSSATKVKNVEKPAAAAAATTTTTNGKKEEKRASSETATTNKSAYLRSIDEEKTATTNEVVNLSQEENGIEPSETENQTDYDEPENEEQDQHQSSVEDGADLEQSSNIV